MHGTTGIATSHVSSPRYAFSGGYVTSVVLSSGVTLTVKLLIDQLAFRMNAMRQCSLRQKWANPTYPHTNKQIRLRDLAEADTSPSLSARRRKDSDKLNNYIRSTLALKTIFTHTIQL